MKTLLAMWIGVLSVANILLALSMIHNHKTADDKFALLSGDLVLALCVCNLVTTLGLFLY